MNKIFVAEPTKRASLTAILEHPWLKGETFSYVNTPLSPIYYSLVFLHCPMNYSQTFKRISPLQS